MRAGEEAGWCTWVLSHTIISMDVCTCNFSYSLICIRVCVWAFCVCVGVCLRQSFDLLPPQPLRLMLSPGPGSCLIPGCSRGHLTARRLSPWRQRLCSHMALMSTEETQHERGDIRGTLEQDLLKPILHLHSSASHIKLKVQGFFPTLVCWSTLLPFWLLKLISQLILSVLEQILPLKFSDDAMVEIQVPCDSYDYTSQLCYMDSQSI